jgi:hypothetical protein
VHNSEDLRRRAKLQARIDRARRAAVPSRPYSKAWYALRTDSARKARAKAHAAKAKSERREQSTGRSARPHASATTRAIIA